MTTLRFCRTLAVLWLSVQWSQALAQTNDTERELSIGVPVERDLRQHHSQSYRVAIAPRQFVRFNVDVSTMPVTVTLVDASGNMIAEWDTASEEDALRPQSFMTIAPETGIQGIRVRLSDVKAEAGRYSLVLLQPRVATGSDRIRVIAERELAEGEKLYRKPNQVSRRAAIERLQSALEKFRSLKEDAREARTLMMLGDVYDILREKETALEYFQRMLVPAAAAGSHVHAQALNQIGQFHSNQLQHQKAMEYLEQALVIAQGAHDPGGQAVALNNIAIIYGRSGQTRRALEYQEKAVPLFHAAGDQRQEAIGLNGLGFRHYVLGEYQKALDEYRRSLELRRLVKDENGEANTLTYIGGLYSTIGEYARALDYFQLALAKATKVENQSRIAAVLNSMGVTYEKMGESSKILNCYEEALRIRHELGDREGEASTINNIGSFYLSRPAPDLPKAIEYFRQAITLHNSVGDPRGEAFSIFNLGKALYRSDEKERALQQFTLALEKARSTNARELQPAVLVQLARSSNSKGDLAGAQAQIGEALTILEELRSRIAGSTARASWLALAQSAYGGTYEFQIDLLMTLGERGSSLEWAERARARSLLDTLAAAGVDPRHDVDPALAERERSLQTRVESLSLERRKLLTTAHTRKQESAADAALQGAIRDHEEAEAAVSAASPAYAALAQTRSLFSVEKIQHDVLDSNTALLEYALGEERSFLWVATRESVTSFVLPRRTEIEALVRDFRKHIGSYTSVVYGETAEQRHVRLGRAEVALSKTVAVLSRVLLAPATSRIVGKRLAVVPADALQYVSFAALPDPGAHDARPLVAGHEIVILPSASTLAMLRGQFSNRAPAPKQLAVLADPVFDPDDTRLAGGNTERRARPLLRGTDPGLEDWQRAARRANVAGSGLWLPRLWSSRAEAQEIASLVPPGVRQSWLDFDASRRTVLSERLADYRMIHFATHGFNDSEHPDLTGLVLSLVDQSGQPTDGFLKLPDISALKLHADLVVLSACQTALGRDTRGEG